MKLLRKTIQAETETTFEFGCKCYKFLVKNFTSEAFLFPTARMQIN